jgi:3-hydroxyisobutyrate dehydrogenase
MTEKNRIAWIGTGVMGAAMAAHLLNAGHTLIVNSRTKSKANVLVDRGAEWADSPADAAEGADLAISIVGYPEDVEAAHLGHKGTLASSHPPKLLIDMTTSRPSLAETIAIAAKAKGVAALDAPVSGGDIGAKNATLSIMVGGEKTHFDQALPILSLLGKNIVYQGQAGAGQHTKMVNQILIATNMIGVCEGLLYASRAGLDPLRVIQSVGSGAAGSWSVNNLGPRMINRDFNPGFYVEHFIKDLGIALDEAKRIGLSLPGLTIARLLYEAVRSEGHGRLGTQALLLTLERMNDKTEPTA